MPITDRDRRIILTAFSKGAAEAGEGAPCPGSKLRSKGQGLGLGRGAGRGPIGVPVGLKTPANGPAPDEAVPSPAGKLAADMPCPGSGLRSLGLGRGLGRGMGRGPVGVPVGAKTLEAVDPDLARLPNLKMKQKAVQVKKKAPEPGFPKATMLLNDIFEPSVAVKSAIDDEKLDAARAAAEALSQKQAAHASISQIMSLMFKRGGDQDADSKEKEKETPPGVVRLESASDTPAKKAPAKKPEQLSENATEKRAISAPALMAAPTALGTLIGGAYGAFRRRDPGEGRLRAILRSALTGGATGMGASVIGGLATGPALLGTMAGVPWQLATSVIPLAALAGGYGAHQLARRSSARQEEPRKGRAGEKKAEAASFDDDEQPTQVAITLPPGVRPHPKTGVPPMPVDGGKWVSHSDVLTMLEQLDEVKKIRQALRDRHPSLWNVGGRGETAERMESARKAASIIAGAADRK